MMVPSSSEQAKIDRAHRATEPANRIVVASLAITLDGFVADERGGVSFLDAFNPDTLGFDRFLAGVAALVMGRRTFDQILSFGVWPYGSRPTTVLTTRPLVLPDSRVQPWFAPARVAASALAPEELRASIEHSLDAPGDIWIVGGARVLADFARADAIDRWELTRVPVLLARGVPLLEGMPSGWSCNLTHTRSDVLPGGVVHSVYTRE